MNLLSTDEILQQLATGADAVAALPSLLPLPGVLALSAEVANPGDYAAISIADPGILFVRRESGALATYLNRCRHRRRPVVIEAAGSGAKGFICPFHAWRYGLDGSLVYAPRHDRPDPADGWDGLFSVAAEEQAGLILSATEPGLPAPEPNRTIRRLLGDLAARLPADLAVAHRFGDRTEEPVARALGHAAHLLLGGGEEAASFIAEGGRTGIRLSISGGAGLGVAYLFGPATLIVCRGAEIVVARAHGRVRGGCDLRMTLLAPDGASSLDGDALKNTLITPRDGRENAVWPPLTGIARFAEVAFAAATGDDVGAAAETAA